MLSLIKKFKLNIKREREAIVNIIIKILNIIYKKSSNYVYN
jgi:hypothetical protein